MEHPAAPPASLTRRRFRGAAAATALGAAWSARRAAAAPPRRPNVIVIYTDDQGCVDAGCYGAKDLATPNLDALAARGVRFTQFYAPAAVCSPSRAGLLTGRYPLRAGVPNNVGDKNGLPGAEITMAEVFHAAGYATAHIGKWHLGQAPDTLPNAQGFDHSFGHLGGCIDNYSHFFYWSGPNRHDLQRNGEEVFHGGRFFPDLMVEEASQFIESHKDSPFFLYFAMNTPHYPYQGDEEWLRYYRDKGTPYPRDLYAAFVSTLDTRIGRLVEKLTGLGLLEDTIIVFQADNGHSVEERAHFGGGDAGPHRAAKFSMFEGGIRVPAVISWPGQLPEGEVREQVGHGCDWMPTLVELCGVTPPDAALDGKSLVPVLRSGEAPTPHDVLHWHTGMGPRAQWAVRRGDWKLIGNPVDPVHPDSLTRADELFLCNLAQDIGETRNLAGEHPERVKELKALHEAWLSEMPPEREG
ncbi:MAG: sulfatase [Candidatus Hydrogenedentes bacterium]|nr:sulfatase [Candidatus Hydrogenedentota bacterium]